ncbi:putative transcription factor interactor and regulator CCHC(Zn) family [Helianthus debilis subsp. tardiflorus]
MADPYWRYTASADRGAYSGYLQSDASTLSSQPWRPSSDYLQKDILGERTGLGIGARPEPSSNGYPSTWEDPYSIGRRDVLHGTGPVIPDILNDRPDSLRKADSIPVRGPESNVLFVDGLPSDCSRREVSHLFRPFSGFQEIRLVHKEPRHNTDKPMVLCFVEFSDSNRALTALEALQGYKFDNKKPNSPDLRIHFAHFPFQLPSDKAAISSQPSPDNARFPSQPAPNVSGFLSQPPRDSPVYPSKLPHGSAHFPSQQPPKLPPDGSQYSSQLPPNSAYIPSQLPPSSAHSPLQLPPHREEQDLAILREKELAVQDEEPATKKFKSASQKKKEREEANKNKQKKWCIKCKQNHYGECYNFKGCYICGQTGHIGKECTSKPRLCYGCGEPGHKHSVCPNGPRPEKKGKKEAPLKT